MTDAIVARGVVKRARTRRGPVQVLGGVDLDVVAGRVTAIVAPSFGGKSTLVHILAGWEPLDGGEVRWARGRQPGWGDVAVIPQGFALLDELSVEENLVLPRRTGAIDADDDRLAEVCRAVGIDHLRERSAAEISVGERQRTMIARALLGRPPCVLADEPLAHQDERNGQVVLAQLRQAADDGAAILIATRNPDLAVGIADAVVELPGPR